MRTRFNGKFVLLGVLLMAGNAVAEIGVKIRDFSYAFDENVRFHGIVKLVTPSLIPPSTGSGQSPQRGNFQCFSVTNPPLEGRCPELVEEGQGGVTDFYARRNFWFLSQSNTKSKKIPAAPAKNRSAQIANPETFPGLAPADSNASKSNKSPTGAMVRSILFPGWGQLYNGKWLKALLVFGLEAGFIGAAVYLNQKAHDDQDTADNRAFYADQRNANYWRTGVVILLSMLDAYVDAHLSDFDESPDLSFDSLPVSHKKIALPTPEFRISYRINF